ncbi:MAG: hypothetical protein ACTSWK_00210 [Promethearchaeota archaeon]
MKIYKSWIFSIIFLFVAYFVMLYGIWHINLTPTPEGKILINILMSLVAISAAGMGIGSVKGRVYYQYINMPIKEFNIILYDNKVAIIHKNHIWTFTEDREKIEKLKKIKTLHYYDIKKKSLGWKVTPYKKR